MPEDIDIKKRSLLRTFASVQTKEDTFQMSGRVLGPKYIKQTPQIL